MSEELKLTPFQQRFVDFRAQGKSQGDAYILAGGKGNEKNINRLAWRTDNHPKVKEALNRAATVAFERNVGQGSPLKIARGLNGLWTKGGLLFTPPFQ